METMNLGTYHDKSVVRDYLREDALQAPEKTILRLLGNPLRNGRILDIGVGGGRTTQYLLEISENYLGIDYSREMIAGCRQRYPGVRFLHGDARNLSRLGEGPFDLIVFSFNGIDYISHSERLQVLQDVYNLLSDGGYFVFSTHNRHCRKTGKTRKTGNPLRLMYRAVKSLRNLAIHWKNRRYEIHTNEYAIINDVAHDYRLLTYYISLDEQIKQLRTAGFSKPVTAYGIEGLPVVGDDTHSPWIYYVCQR